jgi:Flp pilus assembly protein TadB
MAQTKRRRSTKHRGNAAGMIESRGRTGRKPTVAEKDAKRADARAKREQRLDQPPTWRGALNRALIAAAFLFVVSIVLLGLNVAAAVVAVLLALMIYWPLGYYTDLFLYRRRQRQKAAGK